MQLIRNVQAANAEEKENAERNKRSSYSNDTNSSKTSNDKCETLIEKARYSGEMSKTSNMMKKCDEEDDCVLIEPLKDTVIYIDCEDVDDTLSPTSNPTDKANKCELERNDTTLNTNESYNDTTLEEGEIRTDDDNTLVNEDIEDVMKYVHETVQKNKSKRYPNPMAMNKVSPNNSIPCTSTSGDLENETNCDNLYVIDTIGGLSPISSVPFYNYDPEDKNLSTITINDTLDLTGIDEPNDSVIFCGEYMNVEKKTPNKRKINPIANFIPIDFDVSIAFINLLFGWLGYIIHC